MGSVIQRKDGLWAGIVELEREGGKRKRRVVYSRTREGVMAKMPESERVPRRQPSEPRASKDDWGLEYFVRVGNAVKIGFTTNLAERMDALSTASPYEPELLWYTPCTKADEQELHRVLKGSPVHLRREWYRADWAVGLIQQAQSQDPDAERRH